MQHHGSDHRHGRRKRTGGDLAIALARMRAVELQIAHIVDEIHRRGRQTERRKRHRRRR